MTDIQAGDVVVCVDDDWARPLAAHPKLGDVLRVSDVVEGVLCRSARIGCGLRFAGKPRDRAWAVSHFRKLDKATDEFTSQIKAIRPIREDA